MASCGANIALWFFLAFILGASMALQCYKCGMYNDGVGSITPCINDTNMPLLECPVKDHKYCIKYQSEGSTVRDCVAACTEREDWGAKTFCCDEDGCNSGSISEMSVVFTTTTAMLCIFLR